MSDSHPPSDTAIEESLAKPLPRRAALKVMGVAALATFAASCGGSTSSSGTNSGTGSTGSSNTSCTATLEGEEGPYFVDDSASGFNRSNILSNLDGSNVQAGVPLTLQIYVYDSKNDCAAMPNVQVDIWHCSADGVYSAEDVESTVGETWLRGYQVTDSNGLATFTTIFPGWYQGRTTHIHLRLRSTYESTDTGGTNTTQLFFPQDTIDTINTSISPYSSHGSNPTTNAGDHVYASETQGQNVLSLTGDTTSGFTSTIKINLPISS